MGRMQGSDAERSDDSENPAGTPDTANSDAAEKSTSDVEPTETRGTAEEKQLSGRERLAVLWRDHRPKVLASAAALIAAAAGGTALTVGQSEHQPASPAHTVAVTYQVTGEGTATISYNSGQPGEPGKQQQSVELPWTKELRLGPASGKARVSIVLGKNGGRAQCTVAVDGRHRQRSTAFGDFGRASCAAKVPEKAAGGAS